MCSADSWGKFCIFDGLLTSRFSKHLNGRHSVNFFVRVGDNTLSMEFYSKINEIITLNKDVVTQHILLRQTFYSKPQEKCLCSALSKDIGWPSFGSFGGVIVNILAIFYKECTLLKF